MMKILSASFTVSFALILSASLAFGGAAPDPDDYDRLDGVGRSGKKVQVIEWEGNLEIHAYPPGSLKGLALKLDKKNKDKPVMVIGYRFDTNPKSQLIRRAILGIDLSEGFKTFRDPRETEFDKVIISMNGLSDGVVAYRLDPEPSQLYPDGHPALAKTATPSESQPSAQNGSKSVAEVRKPAAAASDESGSQDGPDAPRVDEEGTIQPFFMKSDRQLNRH